MTTQLDRFTHRITTDWLPPYRAKRGYDPANFRSASIKVCEMDASDCLRAIDAQVVTADDGSWKAARNSAKEGIATSR